jgi:hypothetical protein
MVLCERDEDVNTPGLRARGHEHDGALREHADQTDGCDFSILAASWALVVR